MADQFPLHKSFTTAQFSQMAQNSHIIHPKTSISYHKRCLCHFSRIPMFLYDKFKSGFGLTCIHPPFGGSGEDVSMDAA